MLGVASANWQSQKWGNALVSEVEKLTGSTQFTYVTARDQASRQCDSLARMRTL